MVVNGGGPPKTSRVNTAANPVALAPQLRPLTKRAETSRAAVKSPCTLHARRRGDAIRYPVPFHHPTRTFMKRSDLTEKILDIKRTKNWSWKYICGQIGGLSPVLIVGALLGQMKLTKPLAAAAAKLFGLDPNEEALLNEVPMRGQGVPMPPTDPLIYRLYELVMVNGPALKVLIEEEFGDGIMSAIDFDLALERQPDAKGDRVKISMSGKFLPFKYYGATGNHPAYGYREEQP